MPREFLAYLRDIQQAGNDIQAFTSEIDLLTFASSALVHAAVERKFEIIGEAMVQARHHHSTEARALGDVRPVISFRNLLAHNYDEVETTILWEIVQGDLPELLAHVQRLIEECERNHE